MKKYILLAALVTALVVACIYADAIVPWNVPVAIVLGAGIGRVLFRCVIQNSDDMSPRLRIYSGNKEQQP